MEAELRLRIAVARGEVADWNLPIRPSFREAIG
jgi:hypothetical protein